MNLTPWKMWDLKTGGVAEGAGTAEAVDVLESAFRDIPASWSHPGLLHLYVHLMEMSPFPQRALRAGDRLRDLVPDAGHLIHMPTHIDVLCGHYRDVLVYNQKAIAADRKFLAREGAMNVYALYRTHDYHFAIYGAMFLGQYGPAMEAAQELIDTTPEALLRIPSPPMADFVEGYLPMKQHVLVRFGKWHEIIAQELPRDRELYCSTTAMMLYAQAVAHSALGDIAEAEAAKAAFLEAKLRVPESRRVHNNTVKDLLEVAEAMLTARSSTGAATTRWPSPICAARSSSTTRCPTTSRGAGCSRPGTRSARCCWSRAGSPRPRRSTARISASTASSAGPASIRTTSGACTDCTNA